MVAIMSGADNGFFYAGQVMHFSSPFTVFLIYHKQSKQDDTIIGTRGYAAPEQYVGKSDCRTDIFALGMTMHYLLTGVDPNQPPYETKPIREINPQFSARLEAIIVRCIAPNADDRFQTCDELMQALEGGPISYQKKQGLFTKLFGKK